MTKMWYKSNKAYEVLPILWCKKKKKWILSDLLELFMLKPFFYLGSWYTSSRQEKIYKKEWMKYCTKCYKRRKKVNRIKVKNSSFSSKNFTKERSLNILFYFELISKYFIHVLLDLFLKFLNYTYNRKYTK